MKKILITLMCACVGLAALSVPNSDSIILTEQLQVLPLTGYVRLGDVDANGWVPVEYVGTENVTLSATVNGTNVSIVNHKIKLPNYGTHVVVITVKATGYATLTVTFDDVTWEQDPHNEGYWIVILDRILGNEVWFPLMPMNNGRYANVINLYSSMYDYDVSHFRFVIDGVTYGAPGNEPVFIFDEMMGHPEYTPLVKGSSNTYYVDTGFSYWFEIILIINDDYELDGYNANLFKYASLSYILGDVNGDNNLNISDVTALIDYLLTRHTSIVLDNADVDDSGNIRISDVTALIDKLLN